VSTPQRPGEVAPTLDDDLLAGASHVCEGDLAVTDEVLNEEGQGDGALVAVLTRLQERLGCVAPPVQEVVARGLDLPPVTVQEVVSFEGELSPWPRRGSLARLCGGAACLAPHGLGLHHAVCGARSAAGVRVESVPCFGSCWGAPVAELDWVRREHLSPEAARELAAASRTTAGRARCAHLRGVPATPWRREELDQIRVRSGEHVAARRRATPHGTVRELLVCNGSACSRDAADRVAEALSRSLAERALDRRLRVVRVGCRGEDVGGVTITACPAGWRVRGADERRAAELVATLERDPASVPADALWLHHWPAGGEGVLRRCGFVDPCSLEEYVASGGFSALERVLGAADGRRWGLHILQSSGLRARDGEGEPLAERFAVAQTAGATVVLCPCIPSEAHLPADSLLLGGDPFSVIEGVLLAGVLCDAKSALVMPPAGQVHLVEQVELAVALARRRGLLGSAVLGTPFSFDIRVVPAPRQLVAADESALRRLLLGRGPLKPSSRAMAAHLPQAVTVDPESAARLAGVLELEGWRAGEGQLLAARRLVTVTGRTIAPAVLDVPITATLEQVLALLPRSVEAAATGVKGVLSGGLTGVFVGGCETGAGVASLGSLLVLDEATCVAELLAGMLTTLAQEACGACAPGRTGVRALRDLWARVTAGEGGEETLALIRDTAAHVGATARCALGRGAARMVISALATFAQEVAVHLVDGRCPAGRCAPLARGHDGWVVASPEDAGEIRR